jgi:sulfite exporter TauE/SafE
MSALVWAVLAASLLGSPHCAGMCGGFVAFYAGGEAARGARRLATHAAYHGGRLLTYMLLGVAAGILGRGLDLAGSAAGLQRGAALAAGLLMMAWGLLWLLQARGLRLAPRLPRPVQRLVQEALAQLGGRPPLVKALALGLLSTLLPCGWLYAFALSAAGTGDPLVGALVMAVFWLGTLPVLMALGLGVQALAGPLRRHLPALSALLLLAIGAWTVAGRAAIPTARFAGIRAAVEAPMDAAPRARPAVTPACCQNQADTTAAKR